MKTDRELLELAAKSVGLKIIDWYGEREPGGPWAHHTPRSVPDQVGWNPLTDDGDALRLAVKLGMNVEVNLDDGCTRIRDEFGSLVLRNMFLDGDADAATRRAIVRAAAIGENMK